MMIDDDLYGELTKIIQRETIYLRHYMGEVVDTNDKLKKGRVKATIPELGFISKDLSIWCNPRQGHSLSVPKVGAWVEIYFLNGDSTMPVYLHLASNVKDNTPKGYTGDTKKHVLFEDPVSEDGIILYDNNGNKITFLKGEESFVLGDTAKTELDKDLDAMTELQNAINSWSPAPNDGGAALKAALTAFLLKPMANYSSILSEKIKGK